jgi:hypothetical protein
MDHNDVLLIKSKYPGIGEILLNESTMLQKAEALLFTYIQDPSDNIRTSCQKCLNAILDPIKADQYQKEEKYTIFQALHQCAELSEVIYPNVYNKLDRFRLRRHNKLLKEITNYSKIRPNEYEENIELTCSYPMSGGGGKFTKKNERIQEIPGYDYSPEFSVSAAHTHIDVVKYRQPITKKIKRL